MHLGLWDSRHPCTEIPSASKASWGRSVEPSWVRSTRSEMVVWVREASVGQAGRTRIVRVELAMDS